MSSFVEGGAERREREVGREGDTERKREMKGERDIRREGEDGRIGEKELGREREGGRISEKERQRRRDREKRERLSGNVNLHLSRSGFVSTAPNI